MSHTTNTFVSGSRDVPSYEKNISICLGANGFSFSIISVDNELLAYGTRTFKSGLTMGEAVQTLRSAFAECGLALFGFNSVEVVVLSEQFLLIPDHLYEAGKERKYMEPMATVPVGMGVYSSHVDTLGAQAIFTADTNWVSAFRIVLPGVKLCCQYSKLINGELTAKSDMKSLLVMHLRGERTDFVVYCNKKVQFINTFDCANTQELLYNAINIMKQLHLEDAALEAYVCGDIDRPHFDAMRRYFPKLDLYSGRALRKSTLEFQQLHTYRDVLIFS